MSFRVLSIDGGGMRGIYTAAYLDALEKSFVKKRNLTQSLDIGKAFQLIVGTSTGAIIGCGLAKGIQTFEMVRLYQEHGKFIFPKKMPSKFNLDLIIQAFRRPAFLKKGDDALAKALIDVFGDTTLGQLWNDREIALAIPAVHMANFRSYVFKTPHTLKSNHRDDHCTLADICRASSAAPLFRSLAAINCKSDTEYDVFTDGGLWANNPVIVALIEALQMAKDKDDTIEIFCLGSCGYPEGEIILKDSLHRGFLEWKFGSEAAKVSIAAQEFAFDRIATMLTPHLKQSVKIIRFPNDKLPGALLQYLDLDETSPEGLEALMRQARHDADMTNSEIQQGTVNGQLIENLFTQMPVKN